MIPQRLSMRNFMCYREQSLDLSGIHLACLTGNNGHGKSAILDALTWALWGYSRVGARRDDELIHIGQSEMEVEFEFLLAGAQEAADLRYRVLRKRTHSRKRRRGQSSLELQGWDPTAERFRSLSEPTISATQTKINELLRMDYDTFINSAFLLQGRADEFTIKRPAERKQVLSDILGLEMYDRYESKAREAAASEKKQAEQLVAAIEQIDRELDREDEYRAQVVSAEQELARLQEERASTEQAFAQAQAALQKAQAAQEQLDELNRRIAADQAQADRLAAESATHEGRLLALEAALERADDIEARYAAFQETAASNQAMNAKLAGLVSLREQHREWEKQIADAQHKLDVQRHSLEERVSNLLSQTDPLPEQAEQWAQAQQELLLLDQLAAERETLQDARQELGAQIATLAAENKRAEEDAQQIKDKLGLLTSESTAEARCPLCGQALSEHDCTRLAHTLQEELEAQRQAYRERTNSAREHQEEMKTLAAQIKDADRRLHTRIGLQRKEAALAHTLEQARRAQEDLPQAQSALQEIQTRLKSNAFADAEREELRRVEQELSALDYHADLHRQVQARLDTLRDSEDQMQTLREARSNIETVRMARDQIERSRQEVVGHLAQSQELAAQLVEVAEQAPALLAQAREAQQTLERAHDREQQAGLLLGAARNKVEYCADLRRQRARRERQEQAHRREQAIYEELGRAFGKNGVQAMIIEGAIPEIESEANQLLARMTRGQMHVVFDTQRSTQKGSTIETLDIHITDALGTRRYETFSGGERYRIDFAIRIALSRLLARRAGAQLRMLVIDEGFGTQDVEGRDGLVEAINTIQDDFGCILVITHIDELKDAFNVRIDVEKTPDGSQISIR